MKIPQLKPIDKDLVLVTLKFPKKFTNDKGEVEWDSEHPVDVKIFLPKNWKSQLKEGKTVDCVFANKVHTIDNIECIVDFVEVNQEKAS